MASSMIHLAIVQEMRKKVSFRDINRLFLGVILPDGAVAGNSHLKKKICENTRYTYDLECFRDRYGKYMEKDDLYLGYYLHLIQDMLYRRFMYGEHGWNSSVPGNVEKLHRDYEILNEYVSKKYGLFQEMIQELDLTEEPLAQLAEFDVKGLIKEVRREFTQRKKRETFHPYQTNGRRVHRTRDGILRGRAKSTVQRKIRSGQYCVELGKTRKHIT